MYHLLGFFGAEFPDFSGDPGTMQFMGTDDFGESLALGYTAFSKGVPERIVEVVSLFVFIMLSYPAQPEIHSNSNYIALAK